MDHRCAKKKTKSYDLVFWCGFGLFKPALVPRRRLKIGSRKFYGRHLSGSRLAKRAGLPAPLLRLGYRHFCPVGIPAAFRVIMIARSGAVNDLLQPRRRCFCRFRCRFGRRLPLCRRVLFCRRFLCCRFLCCCILCCRCGFFSGRRLRRHFGGRFTRRRSRRLGRCFRCRFRRQGRPRRDLRRKGGGGLRYRRTAAVRLAAGRDSGNYQREQNASRP